ncbi:MAG: hypothetical protein HQK83_20190 [Fibrobacteria bacterium]|nr:hypothetical protein [Fibrobacteria bacterium]
MAVKYQSQLKAIKKYTSDRLKFAIWYPKSEKKRLEQRFGRIHRIGQKEVCHLWNLLANGTREHDVFSRLLEKLKIESKDLGGDVFNVLGELFHETSLQDLLVEAVRLGDTPEIQTHR